MPPLACILLPFMDSYCTLGSLATPLYRLSYSRKSSNARQVTWAFSRIRYLMRISMVNYSIFHVRVYSYQHFSAELNVQMVRSISLSSQTLYCMK
ncbi:hypothetical protein F5Y06DRAFT_80732 [Hypoxylon sp. FL0890]|nr:hypothetical protein F5Y06DRAFT_80732 [Hypoxylon sp. FL0890]